MRGIAILKSKLSMPQLPAGVLVPERLRCLCARMSGRRAVVITAPAGYGKTTLMLAALHGYQEQDCRVCWYRLGEEDRDLAVFYSHLVETLFPEEEGIWEVPRNYLADSYDIFAQHQYLNALFCQELWAWQNLHPDQKTFIVFDDFQQVLDTPEITATVQFLIDNLPDNCTVLVSSRWSTGLLTGKRRLDQNILEINQSKLCFSEDELASLIEKRFEILPDRVLLHKIMLHTEGWAAGIILVCQMLRDGADQAGCLLDRLRSREPFFQYIATEVVKTVDDRLLLFLVRAAILNDFTAVEAGAIFGEDQAEELLRLCERRGLFIQKIAGPETTYRFHSLFREFLLQIQPRHLAPEELQHCRLQAAAHYIDQERFDQAIEHLIACGSVDQAVALIARESARLIAFEAVDQIRPWLGLLPEDAVSGSGHLLFIKSFIHHQRDLDYTLHLMEQALAVFRQTGDINMEFHTLMQIVTVYILRNDVRGMSQFHALVMDLSVKLQGLPLADAILVFNLTAMAVWEEQLPKVAVLSRRLESLALEEDWQYAAYLHSAIACWMLGDLDLAEGQIRQALKLDFVQKSTLFKIYCHGVVCVILLLTDKMDVFCMELSMMLETGEKHNFKYALAFGKRLAAINSYRRHDLEDALEQIEDSTRLWEEIGNQAMANSNRLYRCLWQYNSKPGAGVNQQQCDARQLLADAKKALKSLTAAPSGMCLHDIGRSVMGAVAREAEEYQLAEKSLTMAVKKSRAKGAKQIQCGACLHLAKLYFDTDDHSQGEDYLRQAFDLAEENSYTMFWDLHHPTLVEMAARCIKSRIHAGYARALIARYYGTEAAGYFSRKADSIAGELISGFANTFIERYCWQDDQQSPGISVNLFGKFEIAVDGVPIPDSEWKTKKIPGTFKYLLINRGIQVSRTQLMDLFWPEADQQSALYSLRAALYELRRVLRKYGVPLEGKASFLNDKRDSLGVRTGHLLTIDVDAFLACLEELKKLPANGDGTGRKKILEKMIPLYRGDLLENDGYEWVFAQREELRSLYFSSVIELADIYITGGDNLKAEKLLLKALAMDPYHEEACLRLLKLYIATNQRGRAVKLYSDFANRFEKELDIKPDERLELVIKK